MCGIAGIISSNLNELNQRRLKQMTKAIEHRGPKGDGFWINKTGSVGFGHRRLSIIDLSEAGAQPMHYLDRYTITYNGEIYNYLELREDLRKKGFAFHSMSDTEVILAAYACYGQQCLQYFDGMFAFAIWDELEQKLFCARDRFGEKPFYYYHNNDEFLFGSEMKALWAAGVPKEMDNSMMLQYIAIGSTFDSANHYKTFYKNIFKLPRAHCLTLRLSNKQGAKSWSYENVSFWDLDKETIISITEAEAIEQFNLLLSTSVKRRLRSDVPLGTSLSGGLDSSSIVAHIQAVLNNNNNQKTFSAIFPGFEKDESKQIADVASKFNVESFVTTPNAVNLVEDFKRLIYHQEEPFQSSSIYAQFKVYELAKQQNVTVLLDGQGADETLAGYHKYYHWYWQELLANRKNQQALKEVAAAKSLGVNTKWGIRNHAAAYMPWLTAHQLQKKALNEIKNHPFIAAEFLAANKINRIYKPVVEKLNDMLYFNTMQNGLEELLRYADRNSMAHSREVRLPFLNHELVQFIFSLPPNYKIRDGWTKWILRKSMNGRLPGDIVWRKDKVGFEPPQKQWMKQPAMIELIYDAKRKLVAQGVLKRDVLTTAIKEQSVHEKGNYDWRYLCAASFM